MKTAVVILNWNGAALLRRFLPSVIANTSPEEATVIVADNGSTDDSLQVLTGEFPGVEVIRFDRNHGFAQGYNLALEECRRQGYDFALLLNSDVEVPAGWLAPMLEYMHRYPDVAACQPKILWHTHPDTFEYAGACGGFIDRNGYPYCRGRIMGTLEKDGGQYDEPMEIFWASGAAMLVRIADYFAAGGLDPRFFAHMEEIDLCWRMQLLGHKIAVVPQSRVYHLGGGSLDAGNPRKTYLNFRNNLLMLHKNLPDSSRRTTLLRRRLLDTIAWAKYAITLHWRHAAAIWRAHRDFARMRRLYTGHPADDLLHTSPRRPDILTSYYLRRHRTFSSL